MSDSPARILLTGAGGPAAISFFRSLSREDAFDFHMADMDPLAQGLYLVDRDHRHLLPAGGHPDFIPRLLDVCERARVDVLVPTVDAELLAIARARHLFAQRGVRVAIPELSVLERTLDKQRLIELCQDVVPVPRSVPMDRAEQPARFPVLLKPRAGSGSRGIRIVHDAREFASIPRDPDLLVQQYLPGEEYSVDVVTDPDGEVVAAVPRVRHKVDSGVAVVARTVHDEALMRHAAAVVSHMGLTGIVNVQFKRDEHGRPCLLEVNPRVPGTISLTIAAGIHMPRIMLQGVLGEESGEVFGESLPREFKEVAVVRHLTEVLVEVSELDAMIEDGQDTPTHRGFHAA